MKIRSGFVSNSSSSSFIIVGKQVYFGDIKEGDLIYAVGKEMNDGTDVFKVTPEIYAWLKARNVNAVNFNFMFYKTQAEGMDADTVDGVNLPNITVTPDEAFYEFDKDYHSCESVSDLEVYYDTLLKDDIPEDPTDKSGLPWKYVAFIGKDVENTETIKNVSSIWAHIIKDNVTYMVHLRSGKDLEYFKKLQDVTFFRVRRFVEFGENLETPMRLSEDKLFQVEVNYICGSILNYEEMLKRAKK